MSDYPLFPKVTLFLFLIVASPALLATTALRWFVGADAEYHDNMGLVPDNEKSDTDIAAQTRLLLERADDPLRINLDYTAARHNFIDNVQTDQTTYTGNSVVNWDALPERLQFDLSHSVSEQQQNRRSADTLDSRERVSILTGGVKGFIHPTSVDTIILNPSYTDVRLQKTSDSNSQHASAELAWEHKLSPVSTLTLSASHDDARFDSSQNDYRYNNAMLTYSAQLARLTYSIAGGFNQIDRDLNGTTDGYTASINAKYIENDYDWGGSLVRKLTDSALGLRGDVANVDSMGTDLAGGSIIGSGITGGGILPSDGNVGEFDIVEATQAQIFGRRHVGPSVQVKASVSYRREDYQVTPHDDKSWRFDLGYSQMVARYWEIGMNAAYTDTDFTNTPEYKQRDTDVVLFANWRLGQRLTTYFNIGWKQRNSEAPAGDYTDHSATAGFQYQIY